MNFELNDTDYKNILEFYGKKIPRSKRLLKKDAERIMANKLCRCIKKIKKNVADEPRAIGICSRSVFKTKGLTRGKFKCIGNKMLSMKKTVRRTNLGKKTRKSRKQN